MFDEMLELARKQPQIKTQSPKFTGLTLDDGNNSKTETDNRIAVFQEQAIASDALNYFTEWCETLEEDLEESEGFGDRLMSLMVACADDNKDGELSEEEQEVINIALNTVFDYLIEKGVSEENATDLLEDFDNDLARNIHEFVLSKLPEGEEALAEEMDNLVFSAEENQALFDSALTGSPVLDAAYRKTFAIRNGKKMRINKRISGKVRLSAKQRMAIKKAQRRANTGAAKMRRLKSFRMHKRMIG